MTSTYRWTKAYVDPDEVLRSLQWAGAVKSWEASHHARYQLGACRVECFTGQPPTLLISGPTEDAVRDGARRLLYTDTDGTVIEIKDEMTAR